jgi:flagellar biosynthesis protein FlhG
MNDEGGGPMIGSRHAGLIRAVPSDQAETLRRLTRDGSVAALERNRPRALAVTGGKGGVGKSTIAVNLAVSYASRGSRTLAVDGDLGMADLNLLLGLAPGRSLLDVLDGAPVSEVLVSAHGIDLLPALNGSHRLANLTPAERARLISAIESALPDYDTLVIDIPAGIGETAMTLASSAADVVVVTTPEPLALADAYACMKVLATRYGLRRCFLLPNSVRSPSQAEEIVGRLKVLVDRFLGIEMVPLPAVPRDEGISDAAAAGVPMVLYQPESPASRAIKRAARHLDTLARTDAQPALKLRAAGVSP